MRSRPIAVAGEVRLGRKSRNPWVELELVRTLRSMPACAFLATPFDAPRLANAVYASGLDVVSVAHRDVLSAGSVEALVERLEHAAVRCVGWGETPFGPAIVRKRGETLAVCAGWFPTDATRCALGDALASTPDLERADEFLDALRVARDSADRVVALIDQGKSVLVTDETRTVIEAADGLVDVIALAGAHPGEHYLAGSCNVFVPGTFHDVGRRKLVVGNVGIFDDSRFELLPIQQTGEDDVLLTELASNLVARVSSEGVRGVVLGAKALRRVKRRVTHLIGREDDD